MILDDFVFLGTTVPEQSSDGRIMVCSAGYSGERRSLVRVYPLPRAAGVHRWEMYRLPLETNPHDSRPESYKLRHACRKTALDAVTDALLKVGKVPATERLAAVDRYLAPSIAWLNSRRASLGVIIPEDLDYRFESDMAADAAVLKLFDDEPAPKVGRRSFPKRPRIRFVDDDGQHDLSFNEWGAYEWLRKNPERPVQVFENLRFGASDRDVRLLVGNFNHHRTSWCVVAYLSFAKSGTLSLPLELA